MKFKVMLFLYIFFLFGFSFSSYGVDCSEHNFSYDSSVMNVQQYGDGTHSYSCLNSCGCTGTESDGAGGKEKCNFVLLNKVEPTCINTGKRIFTCSICFFHYEETIPVKEHNYEIVAEPLKCTEKTQRLYSCRDCSFSLIKYFDATGHRSNGGLVSDALSDDNTVVIIDNCRICGKEIGRKSFKRVVYNDKLYSKDNISDNTFGVDEGNNSSSQAAVTVSKVRGLKFKRKSKSKIVFIWNKTECDGYQVKYTQQKSFPKNTTTTRFVNENRTVLRLKRQGKYYLKVRAFKTVNGKKHFGPYSKVKTLKIKK